MKEIKINFTDFWGGFVPEESFFYRFLSRYYKVVLAPDPDYLFYSCGGYDHLRYPHSVKIFFTGENIVPDFNVCDYGIGFHHLQFEDRYLRFPLFLIHKDSWEDLPHLEQKTAAPPEWAQRRFCNFVYSNGREADPLREYFFRELSKYKRVDSGGRYLNNIGGPVADKLDFLSHYKFTIAFENCAMSGYTTEKILDPMRVSSLPVYYGDPHIDTDFNPASFVWVESRAHVEEAIEEIIRLDKDDPAYLEKLSQPWFTRPSLQSYYTEQLLAFFRNIFEPPLTEAFRTTDYAWAGLYKRNLRRTAPLTRNYLFNKAWDAIDRLKKKKD